jgi:heme-degrading monooxygenase HmoA
MHGRMARYAFTGDAHTLARKAEEGMLPIFQSQPGFRAYSLIESEGEVISYSAWDSSEQAEAANAAAATWIAENMSGEIQLQEARTGEILFSTALGVSTKATAGV